MNRQRLLERFLRYVRIETTAQADAEVFPSSPGQMELGRLLLAELKAMGLSDARQDRHGIVLATVPSTMDTAGPVIAFCSHLDTSPETCGKNIRPQVIENYSGGDLALPGDTNQVIRVADNPELPALRGRTIITSDGTTLLGADDKAGVAIIMETAEWLMEQKNIRHGPIRICFTCDEEIGRGVDKLDLAEIGAVVCYTLDGHAAGEIDVETFSADLAVVTIHGVNIHPSIAKGRMTNAMRAAAAFITRLPRDRLAPEVTDGRQGFLHPYDIAGGVAEVRLKILLRDFDAAALSVQAELLERAAGDVRREFPTAVPQHGRRIIPGTPRCGLRRGGIEKIGPRTQTHDRPRRHRWLATDRTGPAHPESILRRIQSAFTPGMGLPG
jgi:tripeptide aminopeptidase